MCPNIPLLSWAEEGGQKTTSFLNSRVMGSGYFLRKTKLSSESSTLEININLLISIIVRFFYISTNMNKEIIVHIYNGIYIRIHIYIYTQP